MIPRTLELWASPYLRECARILARDRMAAHDGTRMPDQDIGGPEANQRGDYYGMLAELVVIHAAERHGLNPTGYCVVADGRPPVGLDLVVHGRRLDIKAVPYGTRSLHVNEAKRQRLQGQVDALLPVVFVAEDRAAVFAPIALPDVADWPLEPGRRPYRQLSLSHLRPICGMREIAA